MNIKSTKFERESTKFDDAFIIEHGELVKIRVLKEDCRLTWDEVSSQALDKSVCFNVLLYVGEAHPKWIIDSSEEALADETFILSDVECRVIGVIEESQQLIVEVGAFVEKV